MSGGTAVGALDLASFFAYHPAFPGGVFVAAGDLTGGGVAQIITGAGRGGGPHTRILTISLQELAGFFAYDPAFPVVCSSGLPGPR